MDETGRERMVEPYPDATQAADTARDARLADAYAALAEDYRRRPEPFLEFAIADGLVPSDGSEWQ